MNINPFDFLTEEQKENIGKSLYAKITTAIEKIDANKLSKEIEQDLTENISWSYLIEDELSFDKIAKPIQDKIIKAIKS